MGSCFLVDLASFSCGECPQSGNQAALGNQSKAQNSTPPRRSCPLPEKAAVAHGLPYNFLEPRSERGPGAAGEGTKLSPSHTSGFALATTEQLFTIGSQLAFWPDKPVERLPGNPEFFAEIAHLGFRLPHAGHRQA